MYSATICLYTSDNFLFTGERVSWGGILSHSSRFLYMGQPSTRSNLAPTYQGHSVLGYKLISKSSLDLSHAIHCLYRHGLALPRI